MLHNNFVDYSHTRYHSHYSKHYKERETTERPTSNPNFNMKNIESSNNYQKMQQENQSIQKQQDSTTIKSLNPTNKIYRLYINNLHRLVSKVRLQQVFEQKLNIKV
jgi:hypothetical protein